LTWETFGEGLDEASQENQLMIYQNEALGKQNYLHEDALI